MEMRLKEYIAFYPYGIFLLSLILFLFSCKKKDETAPVITLLGEPVIRISLNGTYTEPGATAYDAEDGEVSVSISGTVNPDFEGDYTLTYSASDGSGNYAQCTRTVCVRNDAVLYGRIYKTRANLFYDTLFYQAIFTPSTVKNNRIWIQGFAGDSNEIVFADISGENITVIKQQGNKIGSQHYYWGNGQITTSDSLFVSIIFTDSIAGTLTGGTLLYKSRLP